MWGWYYQLVSAPKHRIACNIVSCGATTTTAIGPGPWPAAPSNNHRKVAKDFIRIRFGLLVCLEIGLIAWIRG
jgi:hypothetical protein